MRGLCAMLPQLHLGFTIWHCSACSSTWRPVDVHAGRIMAVGTWCCSHWPRSPSSSCPLLLLPACSLGQRACAHAMPQTPARHGAHTVRTAQRYAISACAILAAPNRHATGSPGHLACLPEDCDTQQRRSCCCCCMNDNMHSLG
jgi:hypothetical protein